MLRYSQARVLKNGYCSWRLHSMTQESYRTAYCVSLKMYAFHGRVYNGFQWSGREYYCPTSQCLGEVQKCHLAEQPTRSYSASKFIWRLWTLCLFTMIDSRHLFSSFQLQYPTILQRMRITSHLLLVLRSLEYIVHFLERETPGVREKEKYENRNRDCNDGVNYVRRDCSSSACSPLVLVSSLSTERAFYNLGGRCWS